MRCLVLVMLLACSQRAPIRHAGNAIGERGEMRFRNGELRDTTFAGFSPRGVVVNDGYRNWEVPYEQLDSFETTSHAGGAWQGFKWGALIGVAIGLVWGAGISQSDDEDDVFDDTGDAMAAGAVMFGLTGAVFGIPIGAIKGKTTTYAVDERE